MNNKTITVEAVEAVLPQTQCGLCGYGGCRPYAEAIVNRGEAIDRCPPGGIEGLKALATLTDQSPNPYIATVKAKEQPVRVARIDEAVCIGCTKCITACPVDAIIGASKQMHSVLESECSGCELCVAPCPVDCIELVTIAPIEALTREERQKRAAQYRTRFENRNQRLARQREQLARQHQLAKVAHKPVTNRRETLAVRKVAIEAAVKRHALKRQPQAKRQDNP